MLSLPGPEAIRQQLREALAAIASDVRGFLDAGGSPQDLHGRLTRADALQAYQMNGIYNYYARAYGELAEFRSERTRENWADLREKVRFLVFRVATAIGIAAVVLGASYVAHEMGIPLLTFNVP